MASLTEFEAIENKEYGIRYRAARNNEKYKVLRSRLSKGQSPIQQAVQDSYITMEELQKNKSKEFQDQQQPDWYSHLPEIANNDDFTKNVVEKELDNNKGKKQK